MGGRNEDNDDGGKFTIQFIGSLSLYPDVSYTERKDMAYLYRFLARPYISFLTPPNFQVFLQSVP